MSQLPEKSAPHSAGVLEKTGLHNPSQRFIAAIKSAFEIDIHTHTPPLIPTWKNKTILMIDDEYGHLSPLAKRSVQVFTSLGETFPHCATLETMTRNVIRTNDFKPTHIIKILDRFQVRARQADNPALLQSSALFALFPLFSQGKHPSDELDVLRIVLALLPPIITATKVDDPQEGYPDGVKVTRGNGANLALGNESDILDGLKNRGFSEEAIKAFKSGKTIRRNITPTPFGDSADETWEGKDE